MKCSWIPLMILDVVPSDCPEERGGAIVSTRWSVAGSRVPSSVHHERSLAKLVCNGVRLVAWHCVVSLRAHGMEPWADAIGVIFCCSANLHTLAIIAISQGIVWCSRLSTARVAPSAEEATRDLRAARAPSAVGHLHAHPSNNDSASQTVWRVQSSKDYLAP